MLRNGVELHMDTERKMSEEEECGHTAVLVAIDGMYQLNFLFKMYNISGQIVKTRVNSQLWGN